MTGAVTGGCNSSVGPVQLPIKTRGVRYHDFVIEPEQEYGSIHGSNMLSMDALAGVAVGCVRNSVRVL